MGWQRGWQRGGTGALGDEAGSGGEAGGSSSTSGDGSGAGDDSGDSDACSGANDSGGDPADPPSIDIDPSSTLDFDPSTPTAIYWPPTCPDSVTDYAYMGSVHVTAIVPGGRGDDSSVYPASGTVRYLTVPTADGGIVGVEVDLVFAEGTFAASSSAVLDLRETPCDPP